MDMHEPNPAQLNANDSDRNPAEATDTASEAGIKTQAGDFAADPEGQAEILQTQALEEQQQNNDQRQQHAEHTIVTEESLLQSVLELLEKEPSEFSSDDINRLRQKFSMLHSETQPSPDLPATTPPLPTNSPKSSPTTTASPHFASSSTQPLPNSARARRHGLRNCRKNVPPTWHGRTT